jgi:F0F1-type ATP synthase assembly protein I
MSENKPKSAPPVIPMSKMLAQGSTIGVQAGCISVGIVILALVGGLFLDQLFNTKPLFVLGLLLLSIPVSLTAMVYSVLKSTRTMRPKSSAEPTKKEDRTLE